MADINTAAITGRLTKDPELRVTASGKQVCSFTVACNRKKKKGEDEAQADFISCVTWDQSADYLSKYGHKGDRVQLDGRIQTRHYEDKDGKTVWVTEIQTNNVSLIPKSGQDSTWTPEPADTYARPVPANSTGGAGVYTEPAYSQMTIDSIPRGMATDHIKPGEIQIQPDDDLPF